jgi:hypothetical protein
MKAGSGNAPICSGAFRYLQTVRSKNKSLQHGTAGDLALQTWIAGVFRQNRYLFLQIGRAAFGTRSAGGVACPIVMGACPARVRIGAACALTADTRAGGSGTRHAIHSVVRIDALVKGALLHFVPVARFERRRTLQFRFVDVQHQVVAHRPSGCAGRGRAARAGMTPALAKQLPRHWHQFPGQRRTGGAARCSRHAGTARRNRFPAGSRSVGSTPSIRQREDGKLDVSRLGIHSEVANVAEGLSLLRLDGRVHQVA